MEKIIDSIHIPGFLTDPNKTKFRQLNLTKVTTIVADNELSLVIDLKDNAKTK